MPKAKNKRGRGYTFTWNNYTEQDVKYVDNIPCVYMIYGKEIGKKGTPHLQGYIKFKTLKSHSQVVKLFKKNHVENVKWEDAAIKYCTKEGNFKERGKRPLTQKKKGEKGEEYWKNILMLARQGKFEELPSKILFHQYDTVEKHFNREQSKKKLLDTTQQMWWYYGASGTGKSRKARTDNPDAYLKMCNKWWDYYKNEEVVLIEDFDKKHNVLCHHLKIWSDRYPFLAEYKGGAFKIRPRQIIITSNYHPNQIWDEQEELEPILRRFKIKKFSKF